MKQVVSADLELVGVSSDNPLPRTCTNKRHAMKLGALKIQDNDHDEILDEINKRLSLNDNEYYDHTESEYSDKD